MTFPSYTHRAYGIPITRDWYDEDGELIDFSTNWTFEVRVGVSGQDAVVTKTAGITGAATSPNLTIDWDADDLDDLTPGVWQVEVYANDGSETRPPLRLLMSIAPGMA